MSDARDLAFEPWRARTAALAHGVFEQPGARAALERRAGHLIQSEDQALAALFELQCAGARELLQLCRALGNTIPTRACLRVASDPGRATLLRPWADLPFGEPDGRVRAPRLEHLGSGDELQKRFHRLVPRAIRKPLGEFHTPGWLAEEALDLLPEEVVLHGSLLDPGCGSGTFLRVALHRRLAVARGASAAALLAGLAGRDLNPLAVLTARTNLLLDIQRAGLALERDLPSPIAWADSVLEAGCESEERFDALVGNPPWVGWDSLSSEYRAAIRERVLPRWELFTRKGLEGLLGFANDDVLHVFLTAAIEHNLRPGGAVVFLVKQSLFQNEAGEDFRRFRIRRTGGGERPLRVLAVHDLRLAGRIFDDGAGATALLHLRDGEATRFPVRWVTWHGRTEREEGRAAPSASAPNGPWIPAVAGGAAMAREGENAYRSAIRHGLKHDAEGVFSLRVLGRSGELLEVENRPELGRRALAAHRGTIESDLVYPYLKSRHTRRWGIAGWERVLLPQRGAGVDDEKLLRSSCPHTYRWLVHHRATLSARRSAIYRGRVFYAMFGLGPYTWLPHRVVWCGMSHRPAFVVTAAVHDELLGEKLIVPDGSHYAIASAVEAEVHYLCALLNSAPVRAFLDGRGGRGKRSLTKSLVARLGLPRFEPDSEGHRALAEFSRAAHEGVAAGREVGEIEESIDRIAVEMLVENPG